MALALVARQPVADRHVEFVIDEMPDEVARQRVLDGKINAPMRNVVAVLDRCEPVDPFALGRAHGVGHGAAAVDQQPGQVILEEEFLLVVAEDDQRVQLRRADLRREPIERGLRRSMAGGVFFRRVFANKPAARFLHKCLVTGRISLAVEQLHRRLARLKAAPFLDGGVQHRRVRRADGQHDLSHGRLHSNFSMPSSLMNSPCVRVSRRIISLRASGERGRTRR